MKRLISASMLAVLFSASIITSTPAIAQDEAPLQKETPALNDEISISYGVLTVMSITNTFAAIFGAAFSAGLAVPDKVASVGCFTLAYNHSFGKHFAVGIDAAYEANELTFKSYTGQKDGNGNRIYRTEPEKFSHCFYVMPTVRGIWVNREHFGFYSRLGAGGMLKFDPEVSKTDDNGNTKVTPATTSYNVAFQVSPIGLEFGGQALRGFTELGLGMEGMLLLGLKYRF